MHGAKKAACMKSQALNTVKNGLPSTPPLLTYLFTLIFFIIALKLGGLF
jgi:hypothetical protein